jgi:hypothetical protein
MTNYEKLMAEHNVPSGLNLMAPIATLIEEGHIVKDEATGEWVMDYCHMGNIMDPEPLQYYKQTGKLPFRHIKKFNADIDTSLPATEYSYIKEWYLGKFKWESWHMRVIVGNYYYNKISRKFANQSLDITEAVEKCYTYGRVWTKAYGKESGKMPKKVMTKLEEMAANGIKNGYYEFQ